jgi:streptomycin 6-kinase
LSIIFGLEPGTARQDRRGRMRVLPGAALLMPWDAVTSARHWSGGEATFTARGTLARVIVPVLFADELVATEGPAARAWVDALPALAQRYLRRWRLSPAGEPRYGSTAVVLPVRRVRRVGSTGAGSIAADAMLKLGWPHPESEHEALALRMWGGRGAVRLLDCDEAGGALLLERLDSSVSLLSLDVAEATSVLAGLLRRLCVPAPDGLRSMATNAARWRHELTDESAALGHPVPRRLLDAAVEACSSLGPTAGRAMVNEDLHCANVLRGTREAWLVIDPKVLTGDPEYGVIPMLWNRFDEAGGVAGLDARFAAIVRAAGLDAARARGWTLVRAVDNWLWELAHGHPRQAQVCAAIATWALDG